MQGQGDVREDGGDGSSSEEDTATAPVRRRKWTPSVESTAVGPPIIGVYGVTSDVPPPPHSIFFTSPKQPQQQQLQLPRWGANTTPALPQQLPRWGANTTSVSPWGLAKPAVAASPSSGPGTQQPKSPWAATPSGSGFSWGAPKTPAAAAAALAAAPAPPKPTFRFSAAAPAPVAAAPSPSQFSMAAASAASAAVAAALQQQQQQQQQSSLPPLPPASDPTVPTPEALLVDVEALVAAERFPEVIARLTESSTGSLPPLLGQTGTALRVHLVRALEACQRTFDAIVLGRGIEGEVKVHFPAPHPLSFSLLRSLGRAFKAAGKGEEAVPYYLQVVNDLSSMHGTSPESPDTLVALNNLAVLLESIGRGEEAVPYYERSLSGHISSFGQAHARTLTAYHNFALVLHHHKIDLTRAEEYYRIALAGRGVAGGETSEDTLRTKLNLACLLVTTHLSLSSAKDVEEVTDALGMLRHVVAARVEAHGFQHVDTLAARGLYARALHDAAVAGQTTKWGPYVEVEYGQLLKDQKAALGAEHPERRKALESFRAYFRALGRTEDADALA
jgi:tetratricopeptide (TPR) repeat protein